MESQVDFLTEGLKIIEELIRIGDLQTTIWCDDCLYQIDNSSDITCGDYIVGKILFLLFSQSGFCEFVLNSLLYHRIYKHRIYIY